MSEQSVLPDYPIPFGYKTTWLAIKSDNAQTVVTALNLNEVYRSSWKAGMAAAYAGSIFVTPPLKKWVLVVGNIPSSGNDRHPDLCTPFLLNLGQRFSDVQFFASHRVTGYYAWARLIEGQIVRQFSWFETIRWNVGSPTSEEIMLGLEFPDSNQVDWPEDEDEAFEFAETLPTPREGDVIQLAGMWGLNPSTLNLLNLPPSTGYVGHLPQISSQLTEF